jgi:NAD(P)-dependent dehydrogenase (short-subunit alcohol dehydrogenase family)
MRLADKTAIVTGAASGIGRAIAATFAAHGAHVVVADLREEPIEGGEPTLARIAAAGGSAEFVRTDVTRWAEVDALVGGTVQRRGRLDVLVNCAALFGGTPLLETTEEAWQALLAVNVTGVFLCCKRAVQQMLTQEPRSEARGRIVNLASQFAIRAAPDNLPYGVSKAAVDYLTRQIAWDYGRRGIVCNAIAPGKILTGVGGRAVQPRGIEYSQRHTALPRLGTPQDVANLALFLASDEASFVTGATYAVDGGWLAG